MIKTVFSKDEVNTGRQREFDYLKGIMMILIFIIHAFQGTLSPKDDVMRSIYIFNSMSGAAVFKSFAFNKQRQAVGLLTFSGRFYSH